MRPRCAELRRVLKDTGSFYYHCDWHASHYAKVMLDQIFGEDNFNTEIIWKRTPAKSASKLGFHNNHDSIFFYTKSGKFTFDPEYTAHSDVRIAQHYKNVEPSTGRRYTSENLTGAGVRKGPSGQPWRGFNPAELNRHWARIPAELDKMDAQGLICWPKKTGGFPRAKRYLHDMKGVVVDSVWSDIPPVNSQAAERVGYPTQKPIPLLERIVRASSDPDDIVLDAFCGCGTALVAAQSLGRRWIGIDVSPTACNVMADRLERDCGLTRGKDFNVLDEKKDEDFLRRIPHFEFENWAVLALGGIPNVAKVKDWGIDGRIYPATVMPRLSGKDSEKFDFMDHWYPVQVKQKDKVGRPDIDGFVAAMMRAGRSKGYFVSFDFTSDAKAEIRAIRAGAARRSSPSPCGKSSKKRLNSR